jgi:hypothetical protein
MTDFHEQICHELFNIIPFWTGLAMRDVIASTCNQLGMQSHALASTSLPKMYASDEVTKVHVLGMHGSKAKGIDCNNFDA